MTTIDILDTGKLSVGASVISGEVIAYGSDAAEGTKLNLKVDSIVPSYGIMNNIENIPLKKKDDTATEAFDYASADTQGLEFPKWILTGIFKSTVEADMQSMGRLIFFTKTKGYKELYAPLDATRTDIISYAHYGEREAAGESTKTIDFVNVIVTNLTINQTPDKRYLKWTLSLVETN